MSIADSYLNPRPPKPTGASGESHATPAQPEEGDASILDRPVSMVGFTLADGTHVAYPYATLLKARFDPERGIVLSFTTDEVIIEGSGLKAIYTALTQHRVRAVGITAGERGLGPPQPADSPAEVLITAIRINQNG